MKQRLKKSDLVYKPRKVKFVINKDLDKYENVDLFPEQTAKAREFLSHIKNFSFPK